MLVIIYQYRPGGWYRYGKQLYILRIYKSHIGHFVKKRWCGGAAKSFAGSLKKSQTLTQHIYSPTINGAFLKTQRHQIVLTQIYVFLTLFLTLLLYVCRS